MKCAVYDPLVGLSSTECLFRCSSKEPSIVSVAWPFAWPFAWSLALPLAYPLACPFLYGLPFGVELRIVSELGDLFLRPIG